MDMWSIAEQMYKPGASTTVKFKMEPKHDHAQKKTIHIYVYIYIFRQCRSKNQWHVACFVT